MMNTFIGNAEAIKAFEEALRVEGIRILAKGEAQERVASRPQPTRREELQREYLTSGRHNSRPNQISHRQLVVNTPNPHRKGGIK